MDTLKYENGPPKLGWLNIVPPGHFFVYPI